MKSCFVRCNLIALSAVVLPSAAGAQPAAAPGWRMTTYASVTDPVGLIFAKDGSLYVGRDNTGSGGGGGDAVKIHKVGPGGAPVVEYGNNAVNDPDTVGIDELGLVTGTPGTVLIGGVSGNAGRVSIVKPDGTVSTLWTLQKPFYNPFQFWFDGAGRLFMADTGDGVAPTAIGATDQNNVMQVLIDELNPRAAGMCLLPGGRILVNRYNGRLDLFDTFGELIQSNVGDVWEPASLSPAIGGEFWAYAGVRKGGSPGVVLAVTDTGRSVLAATGFDGPLGYGVTGVETGPDGAIYASDFDRDRVVRITRCAANCDGNNTLDLFDFLCFVNKFNAKDEYADFDGNANFDLFDFLAFVNAFNAGC